MWLRLSSMIESRSCAMSRLVPLGSHRRSSPLVCSLVGRCHGERGSQKNTSMPSAASMSAQRCGDRVAAGALGDRDRGGEVRFADDEVAVPVAGLHAVLDVGGPVGYRPVFPQRAGLLGLRDAARPTAPAAPRQLRPGAGGQAAARVVRVARPIDRLRAHPHARLAQVRRGRMRGPPQLQTLIDRGGQHPIDRQLGRSLSSRPRARRRVRPAGVIARPPAPAGHLAMHRGPITAQPPRYVRDAAARPERRLDEHPLIQTQPRCHTGHLHRPAACVGNGHHDRSLATTDGVRRASDDCQRGSAVLGPVKSDSPGYLGVAWMPTASL